MLQKRLQPGRNTPLLIMPKEVTQEQFEEVLEDATYLQDEAEALRYVIDTVPYSETPPEDVSILDKLLLLDHIQVNYYRPVFEQAQKTTGRNVKARNFRQFCDDFTPEDEKAGDIQKVLNKLAKHRAAIINIFSQIPLIDWDQIIYKDNNKITLYDFALDMIRKDRTILKEIADMVMVFQKDRQSMREIQSKSSGRGQSHNNQ